MKDNAKSLEFVWGLLCVWMLWSQVSFWTNNKASSANVCWNFQRPQAGHTSPWPYSNRWPICCSKTKVDRFSRARFWLPWCHCAGFLLGISMRKRKKKHCSNLHLQLWCDEIGCCFFTRFLPLCESPMFRLHVAVQKTKCGRNPSWRLVRWSVDLWWFQDDLHTLLGGGFNHFLFSPLPWEMIQLFKWVETTNWLDVALFNWKHTRKDMPFNGCPESRSTVATPIFSMSGMICDMK